MKLYVIAGCPYVQRVLIGLKVRQLPESMFNLEFIDLARPPASMFAINPAGSVPTLEISPSDGFNESLIINEFLDSCSGTGPKLYGNSPIEIAKNKVLLENVNSKFLSVLTQMIYCEGNELQFKKSKTNAAAAFEYLENFFSKCESQFFGGNALNAVDAALAPFIVRYVTLNKLRSDVPMPQPHSRLSGYFQAIVSHPFVMETTAPDMVETVQRYMQPNSRIAEIKNASRKLIESHKNIDERIQTLNSLVNSSHPRNQAASVPLWSKFQAEKGFFIQAIFRFTDLSDALLALQNIAQIGESADHHAGLICRDLTNLELTLCTHEPDWGISEKDLALAALLTEKILEK